MEHRIRHEYVTYVQGLQQPYGFERTRKLEYRKRHEYVGDVLGVHQSYEFERT